MRAYDNGSFFTVTVSEHEVRHFAEQWPCFGRIRAYWFQFDNHGNLVDTNHQEGETDGTAIVALADDAKAYGARKLKRAI